MVWKRGIVIAKHLEKICQAGLLQAQKKKKRENDARYPTDGVRAARRRENWIEILVAILMGEREEGGERGQVVTWKMRHNSAVFRRHFQGNKQTYVVIFVNGPSTSKINAEGWA